MIYTFQAYFRKLCVQIVCSLRYFAFPRLFVFFRLYFFDGYFLCFNTFFSACLNGALIFSVFVLTDAMFSHSAEEYIEKAYSWSVFSSAL